MRWNPRRAHAAAIVVAAFACAAPQPAPGQVIEPDVLPEALWWRTADHASLDVDPLAALSAGRVLALDVEWAPLYAGRDGARIEREQRALRFTTPGAHWRAGAELGAQRGAARGGDHPWWLDAERPIATTGAVGVYGSGERHRAAASVSTHSGALGIAAGFDAQLAPAARATVSLSRVPRHGRASFRLDDIDVLAAGRWIERRSRWVLALAPREALAFHLALQTLDRSPDPQVTTAGDALESSLSWRAWSAGADVSLAAVHMGLSADYGEGRETVRFCREGTAYAVGAGPVTNAVMALTLEGRKAPYRAHAWLGRWRGDAHAAVALWPFAGLAAAVGTRQLATSSGALRHGGVSVDRLLRGASGLEAGVALWRLVPEASYQSWRTTLLGIGRSDASSGAVQVRSLVAAGLRLAVVARLSAARVRLEAVQWVPLTVERAAAATDAEPSAPSVPGVSRPGESERGGTVVRVSIEV